MHVQRGKTKNGSIRRRAQPAGCFVNLQEFSQVARSGRVEAVIAQRSKFALSSWINGQPMERSKMRRDTVIWTHCQQHKSLLWGNAMESYKTHLLQVIVICEVWHLDPRELKQCITHCKNVYRLLLAFPSHHASTNEGNLQGETGKCWSTNYNSTFVNGKLKHVTNGINTSFPKIEGSKYYAWFLIPCCAPIKPLQMIKPQE